MGGDFENTTRLVMRARAKMVTVRQYLRHSYDNSAMPFFVFHIIAFVVVVVFQYAIRTPPPIQTKPTIVNNTSTMFLPTICQVF